MSIKNNLLICTGAKVENPKAVISKGKEETVTIMNEILLNLFTLLPNTLHRFQAED